MKYYNPFTRLAGNKAFYFGLALILITAIIAYRLNVHFNGNLQIAFLPRRGFFFTLMQHLIPWGMYSLVFFIIGVGTSRSRIRFVDMAGTFAIARFPLLIITFGGLFPVSESAFESIMIRMGNTADQNVGHQMATGEIIFLIFFGILSLLMLIWMLALKYNAYRICCNLSGNKLILSFIGGILVSEALARWLFYALFPVRFMPS